MTDPNADRLARLLAALEKLPIASGVVWRGVPTSPGKYSGPLFVR